MFNVAPLFAKLLVVPEIIPKLSVVVVAPRAGVVIDDDVSTARLQTNGAGRMSQTDQGLGE